MIEGNLKNSDFENLNEEGTVRKAQVGEDTVFEIDNRSEGKEALDTLDELGLSTMGKVVDYIRKSHRFAMLVAEPYEDKDYVIQMLKVPEGHAANDTDTKSEILHAFVTLLQGINYTDEEIKSLLQCGVEVCEERIRMRSIVSDAEEAYGKKIEELDEKEKKTYEDNVKVNTLLSRSAQEQLRYLRETWICCPDNLLALFLPAAMQKGMEELVKAYTETVEKIAAANGDHHYNPIRDFAKYDNGNLISALALKYCSFDKGAIHVLATLVHGMAPDEEQDDGKE